ncbi:MAG: dehydrogenase E1 component subunit alpha/beta [Kiritimatiellia bacterium]|nr:dehydrogenase E1 component subunit alpha/beta [Kiritimatiellia bacterium]
MSDSRKGCFVPNYLSNSRPDFSPGRIDCGAINCYAFKNNLKDEIASRKIDKPAAIRLLEDMLAIREFEEMIVKLRSGAYDPLPNFNYRGPTHLSIGQEAASTGACHALKWTDYITSTHRGHGDSIAKGCVALRLMPDKTLRLRLPSLNKTSRDELVEAVIEDHIFRTIAELFGKESGYCKGRGGGMHIADFTMNHLGANAIVGGGVPIATGAALGCRYLRNGSVVCCFAGDGAYANGVVLESLNWAAMGQFTNEITKKPFGLPLIFAIHNNHYGMTGRAEKEVAGIRTIARRAAGFADNNMHAEVVNGMDVLAVQDAIYRAAEGCRNGQGPYLIELNTYRYYGHSLTDPRSEYRTKDEESAWKEVDPIAVFSKQLKECGVLDEDSLAALQKKVSERNARAAVKAADAPEPQAVDVIKYMYTNTSCTNVPANYRQTTIVKEKPQFKRVNGELSYKDAIKEALFEEMARDSRVILYGEDVADYGGAFKVTKGLLEAFGRERVFNTPISEAAICGTAVGTAMIGLRPVVELMYMDFALMASDQISNQAAKWHYMSGANIEIPLIIRASVGGGKGYGGQHSQTLESIFTHIPGLYIIYPSTPYDAKGLLKSAIRDNNPVMFIESQLLYPLKGPVPETDYLVPIGTADIKRAGDDVTIAAWGPAVHDALKAAALLQNEKISAEVIDVRTLVPLDMETILQSVRKTGRCVVASQSVNIGSFTGEIASNIVEQAFDYLDAPVRRVGAKNGIAPQSHILEAAFLPNANDIVAAVQHLF